MFKKIFISLLLVCFGGAEAGECAEQPINVWFKVSNDINAANYGEAVALDMREGASFLNGDWFCIAVKDLNTGEDVIVSFPIAGYWAAPSPKSLTDLEKEMMTLEEYLRRTYNKSTELKRAK